MRERFTEEKLEWDGFCIAVHVIAVGVRQSGEVNIGIVPVLVSKVSGQSEESLIIQMDMTAGLRVIDVRKDVVPVYTLANVLEKPRRDSGSAIRKHRV